MIPSKNLTSRWAWVVSILLLTLIGLAYAYFQLNTAVFVLQVSHSAPSHYDEKVKGTVENSYVLKVQNKDSRDHALKVKISGFPSAVLKTTKPLVQLRAGEVVEIPVSVVAKLKDLPQARIAFDFVIFDAKDPEVQANKEGRFVAPGDTP